MDLVVELRENLARHRNTRQRTNNAYVDLLWTQFVLAMSFVELADTYLSLQNRRRGETSLGKAWQIYQGAARFLPLVADPTEHQRLRFYAGSVSVAIQDMEWQWGKQTHQGDEPR
jgi:hypothetical protein